MSPAAPPRPSLCRGRGSHRAPGSPGLSCLGRGGPRGAVGASAKLRPLKQTLIMKTVGLASLGSLPEDGGAGRQLLPEAALLRRGQPGLGGWASAEVCGAGLLSSEEAVAQAGGGPALVLRCVLGASSAAASRRPHRHAGGAAEPAAGPRGAAETAGMVTRNGDRCFRVLWL